MDSQVVDAIQAAGKPFVPIVGADLRAFVEQLLNVSGDYEGLTGIAVYNPAAVGGAGVKLALQAPQRRDRRRRARTTPSSCRASARRTTTSPKRARRCSTEIERPRARPAVSGQLVHRRLDDYTVEQMLACKGPGE